MYRQRACAHGAATSAHLRCSDKLLILFSRSLRSPWLAWKQAKLDSLVLYILEPQLCVHWDVANTWQLQDSQGGSLQVCYWPRGAQGGSTISTLASYQGEPGPIPGRVTGLSHVGIVPNDGVGRRVFSGTSRFPPPLQSGSILTSITRVGSQDLAVTSRPNLFTQSHFTTPTNGPRFALRLELSSPTKGEPGSIPGGVTPGFLNVGMGYFAFRRCSVLTSRHPHRLSRPQRYVSPAPAKGTGPPSPVHVDTSGAVRGRLVRRGSRLRPGRLRGPPAGQVLQDGGRHAVPGSVRRMMTMSLPPPPLLLARPRLACSPPTRANRVQSPAGSLRIFACGNRARTMPLVGGFSRGSSVSPDLDVKSRPNFLTHIIHCNEYNRNSPCCKIGRCRWSEGFLGDFSFPPSFHSGAAIYSPHLILIGSQDLDVESCPSLFTSLHFTPTLNRFSAPKAIKHNADKIWVQPVGNLSLHAVANEAQGQFPQPRATYQGTGASTLKEPPLHFDSVRLSTLCYDNPVVVSVSNYVSIFVEVGAISTSRTVVDGCRESHQGEPGSILGGVAPRFSHVRIMPDYATGRRFSRGYPAAESFDEYSSDHKYPLCATCPRLWTPGLNRLKDMRAYREDIQSDFRWESVHWFKNFDLFMSLSLLHPSSSHAIGPRHKHKGKEMRDIDGCRWLRREGDGKSRAIGWRLSDFIRPVAMLMLHMAAAYTMRYKADPKQDFSKVLQLSVNTRKPGNGRAGETVRGLRSPPLEALHVSPRMRKAACAAAPRKRREESCGRRESHGDAHCCRCRWLVTRRLA
ncbi:hypothetical protein PR048_024478 [Dryococelus australis]|uniref:Uncharacterized protein n=1 Tax=Dryococelus australis TaxID=614101 RepID=A0ABQ9GNS0_9NEOP|nr:hypothetical protein PR048_024478 [Dryococelus australis]